MNRRTLLAAALVGTAGCLSTGPRVGNDSNDPGGGESDHFEGNASDSPEGAESNGDGGGTTTAGPSLRSEFARREACKTPNDASVAFDSRAVVVIGCIRGANGCTVATLETVAYDEGADSLDVVVAAREERDEDTACTEALVTLGYEVRVEFDGHPPGTVAVVHDGVDGRSRVAKATREW